MNAIISQENICVLILVMRPILHVSSYGFSLTKIFTNQLSLAAECLFHSKNVSVRINLFCGRLSWAELIALSSRPLLAVCHYTIAITMEHRQD